MSLAATQADRDFQREVRDFIAGNFPEASRKKVAVGRPLTRGEMVEWYRILADKGWVAPAWPKEHGGTGWPLHWNLIFEDELALAGCPPPLAFNIKMLGPILIQSGTEEQKTKYLPRLLRTEDWFCQGYSEPGAGSDLASLQTRAVADGDDYVINGSKIWTSFAHYANKMFCLVRTDPEVKPQAGISFVIIDDLDTEGIDIRPIRFHHGRHHFNQVFFTDVRVPKRNRVGAENEGWTVAKSLLAHERLNGARAAESRRALERLKRIARTEQCGGRSLADEDWFQRKLWSLEIDHAALAHTILRCVEKVARGGALGAETSMLKARGTLLHQAVLELLVDAVGYYGLPKELDAFALIDGQGGEAEAVFHGHEETVALAGDRYTSRGFSIAGGSHEVQSMVTAKRVLGL